MAKVINIIIMTFYTIQPLKIISDYVRCFWVLEGEGSPAQPFVHRALADNCAELIFYFRGEFSRYAGHIPEKTFTSGIYGQTSMYQKFQSTTNFGIFGVYLYPHAIPGLFALPASELTNQRADLKTIGGREAGILEEQVIQARDTMHRVNLVTDFLMERLKNVQHNSSAILNCINNAINYHQIIPVTTLAADCNLSRRQFERKFKEISGFSPKTFSNIIRFNAVIHEHPERKRSLTQTAMEHGYYDQSHFIHDFNKFSGYNPSEFFSRQIDPEDYRGAAEFKI